tara:strand:+ start:329 stop:493 length:165 start_codon:yes stop_codon:yes gene_type:complete
LQPEGLCRASIQQVDLALGAMHGPRGLVRVRVRARVTVRVRVRVRVGMKVRVSG